MQLGLKILFSLYFFTLATMSPIVQAADFRLGNIRISTPYIRAMPASAKVTSGYMEIHNQGAQPDQLLEARSIFAGRIEIHEMRIENEVMRMRPLPQGLALPAGEIISLAPGGYHLMIFEPTVENEAFPIELHFAKAGTVEVSFEIRDIADKGGKEDTEGHHHNHGH